MDSKAENVIGQVLICLCMSKLDSMGKETPYSAYFTVRKKFDEGVNEEAIEVNSVEKKSDHNSKKNLDEENQFLWEKVIDLEKNCSILKAKNNEFDLKLKTLDKDKESLEEEIEEAYSDSKNLKTIIESNKKRGKKSFNTMKDLNESVLMLKNQLKTRA